MVTKDQVRQMIKSYDKSTVGKWFTQSLITTFTGITTAGYQVPVPYPSKGVNTYDRTSDSLKYNKFQMKYSAYCGDETNVFRIVVFQLHQAAIPANEDILFTNGYDLVNACFNPYSLGKTFSVCYDRTFTLSKTGSNFCLASNIIDIPIKLKNLNFGKGDIPVEGQFVVWCMSDSALPSNPTIDIMCQYEYDDSS